MDIAKTPTAAYVAFGTMYYEPENLRMIRGDGSGDDEGHRILHMARVMALENGGTKTCQSPGPGIR